MLGGECLGVEVEEVLYVARGDFDGCTGVGYVEASAEGDTAFFSEGVAPGEVVGDVVSIR